MTTTAKKFNVRISVPCEIAQPHQAPFRVSLDTTDGVIYAYRDHREMPPLRGARAANQLVHLNTGVAVDEYPADELYTVLGQYDFSGLSIDGMTEKLRDVLRGCLVHYEEERTPLLLAHLDRALSVPLRYPRSR